MAPTAPELTPEQRRTLAAILEVILPSESGAGATDTGAVDYVAGRLRGPERDATAGLYAVLARVDDAGAFVAALAASDDPAAVALFRRLRAWAWEGMLCDPSYGGNRDGRGWARFGHTASPKVHGHR